MKYIVETDDGMGVGVLAGYVGFGTPDEIEDRDFAERLAKYCNKTFKKWSFVVKEVAASASGRLENMVNYSHVTATKTEMKGTNK